MLRYLTGSLLFCLLSGLACGQTLPPSLQAALDKAQLPDAAVHILVKPLQGAPVLAFGADTAVRPASSMKLLTSLVALEELGPAFRWKTQILSTAQIAHERLRGDLFLRGGGDPNLTWDKLAIMLRQLRQRGLRRIEGDIVLDRDYFQPSRPDLGAPAFDEEPNAYYNVIPDALLVHSNISAFEVSASAHEIKSALLTPLDRVSVHSHLRLRDGACADWDSDWQAPLVQHGSHGELRIALQGSFPKNCQITQYLNLLERNQFVERLLRALWQELGGQWQGRVRDGHAAPDAQVLLERWSDTLADTLRIVNKMSDNAMARILYLSLGAETPPDGQRSSAALAEQRIRGWLARHAIGDSGLVLENGSGLSRRERLSAAQLAAVLQAGADSNWNAEYASSLPIAALDGSMRKRLQGSPAALRARIKTGTLKDAVAVAGYVRDVQDKNWIVVGLVNHDNAAKARPLLDSLIDWVASGQASVASDALR